MHIRTIAGSIALAFAPASYAYVLCSALDPSLDSYRTQLSLVARESGLARLSKDDELAVINICRNEAEKNDELIDARRVAAKTVTAFKKILVLGRVAPSQSTTSGNTTASPVSTNASKPSASEAAAIDRAVDQMFIRWAGTWWSDRYIAGSAHVEEQAPSSDGLLVRGRFSFVRGGQKLTIPLAAAMTKGAGQYAVANLCYNDLTTGMTDCTASGNSSAASRLMGEIIIGGVIAGMSSSSGRSSTSDAPEQKVCKNVQPAPEVWVDDYGTVHTGLMPMSHEECH